MGKSTCETTIFFTDFECCFDAQQTIECRNKIVILLQDQSQNELYKGICVCTNKLSKNYLHGGWVKKNTYDKKMEVKRRRRRRRIKAWTCSRSMIRGSGRGKRRRRRRRSRRRRKRGEEEEEGSFLCSTCIRLCWTFINSTGCTCMKLMQVQLQWTQLSVTMCHVEDLAKGVMSYSFVSK